MTAFRAPLTDVRFVLEHVLGISQISNAAIDAETAVQILETAARFAEETLFPINRTGDQQGCTYDAATGTVKTPEGFVDAYRKLCGLGFVAPSASEEHGGLDMSHVLEAAMLEICTAANMAFMMYPGLSRGAAHVLELFGSDQLKKHFLPKLVDGICTGTMCLTEPQCGTDLGLVTTKAVKQPDGTYAISGKKIFISAGEHDLTGNILHLVLAKIEDPSTPAGTKGISLFAVPKHVPKELDASGERNAVSCVGIERKLGIHANSTCELHFEGAKSWLVGEPNMGMQAMFAMMNKERLGVGIQASGLMEAAYQAAAEYASERVQSPAIDAKRGKNGALPPSVAIIEHPDVRRMLLTIKAQAEGARMLTYWTAMQVDLAAKHPDPAERQRSQNFIELLTPIVKAHLSDNAEEATSLAIQVHGGHGYIEDNDVAQLSRDARITRLYEGANGIQALDLLGRKVLGSKEDLLGGYLRQVDSDLKKARKNGLSSRYTRPVEDAVKALKSKTRRLKIKGAFNKLLKRDMGPVKQEIAAVATDYLKLAGLVATGHMWVKMCDTAQQGLKDGTLDRDFCHEKLQTGAFYMEKIMPQMHAHAAAMKTGARSLMEIANERFARSQNTPAGPSLTP